MRLFGILSWYDESPTWLAACVGSLAQIGVDHVVAVDGAYRHFDGAARSGIEQSEAVMEACFAGGMGVSIVSANEKLWTEVDKRRFCFRQVEMLADTWRDWCIIIDGDEFVSEGDPGFKRTLAALNRTDTHCASARIVTPIDPSAMPGPDNGCTDKTDEIYRKIPVDTRFRSLQSRFWRVMRNMDVCTTHWGFAGEDADGVLWNLRPDIGSIQPGLEHLPKSEVAQPSDMPTIEHRKNFRTAFRREQKAAYYSLRDELGLENAAVTT